MSLSFEQGHITIKTHTQIAKEKNGLEETEHHLPGVIFQDF